MELKNKHFKLKTKKHGDLLNYKLENRLNTITLKLDA